MAPITASQMRKIHAVAREQGLDNDLLHVHVQALTGKESLKELNVNEAVRVIDSLEGKKKTSDMRMTEKQFRYIKILMCELEWTTEDGKPDISRLNGFCSKRFGCMHYKWLTPRQASNVIEGLKNIKNNKKVLKEKGII